MRFGRLQIDWQSHPKEDPALAREKDRMLCQRLFERHGLARGLDLTQGEEYGSYTDEKTSAAWMAWCAALNVVNSYLDPNLSYEDWFISCAQKRDFRVE